MLIGPAPLLLRESSRATMPALGDIKDFHLLSFPHGSLNQDLENFLDFMCCNAISKRHRGFSFIKPSLWKLEPRPQKFSLEPRPQKFSPTSQVLTTRATLRHIITNVESQLTPRKRMTSIGCGRFYCGVKDIRSS